MSKRTGFFLGVTFVITSLFFFTVAVMALPVVAQEATINSPANLSDHFAAAIAVEESSTIEGVLGPDESDFMKIPLNAGYQLRVYGSAKNDVYNHSTNMNDMELNLYKEGGTLLSTQESGTDGVETGEVFFYKGLTAEDPAGTENVYLEVMNNYKDLGEAVNFSYTLTFERIDRSDAFANTDAGYDFSTALDLQLENKKGLFNKNFIGVNPCGKNQYCSTDESDFYMLSMMAEDKLTFVVTPSAEFRVGLALYNGNREQVDSVNAANKGAITELEYISDKDQTVYVDVSSEGFGSYAMEIIVSEGTPVPVTTTPTTTMTTTPTPTETIIEETETSEFMIAGFNVWDYKWYLIGAGVGIVVLIVALMLVFASKKKKGSPQQADVEKLRQQMRTGGKSGAAAAGVGVGTSASTRPGATRTMQSDMKNVPPPTPKKVEPPSPVAKASPKFGPPPPSTPSPAASGPIRKSSPPGGLPKAPSPNSSPQASAGAGPGSVPPPPKPKTPMTLSKPKAPLPPSTPAGSKSPAPPVSPSPGGGASTSGKPGTLNQKAKQDIDDIFG